MCISLPAFTTMDIACDRNIIYTCSRNMEVYQIDLASLEVSRFSQGPYPNCTSMVVSPDGEAILCGITTESSFIYWELSTRREIKYNAGRWISNVIELRTLLGPFSQRTLSLSKQLVVWELRRLYPEMQDMAMIVTLANPAWRGKNKASLKFFVETGSDFRMLLSGNEAKVTNELQRQH